MAGQIPQAFIDELVDRTDIVELIDSRVKLRKSGRNYTACCPFHDEKTPSFSVSQEKQFYHCFGCGAGGNAVRFLMDYDRVSFPEAIESLAAKLGLEVPREGGSSGPDREEKQNLFTILEKANSFYQEQLRSHGEAERAKAYLKQRGLSSQIAHRFGIGFAPPGWDNLLRFAGQEETDNRLLVESGMLIRDDDKQRCYDRFRDRIMFPIRDTRGRVIAFGGRVLGDDKPKYLNSPESPVFSKSRELYGLFEANKASNRLDKLLVVEGYMDVVALAQFDIHFAVATLGTAATAEHLKKAFRYTSNIVFCFDGDEAGRKAAKRALESALPALDEGKQVHFLFLPEGEDPDTLIRQEGSEAFLQRIDQATPLSEYLFDQARQGINPDTAEGRSQLVARTLPLLQKIPKGVFYNMMLNTLASQSQLSLSELEQARPAQHEAPSRPPADHPAAEKHTARPEQRPTGEATSSRARPGHRRLSLTEQAIFLLLNFPAFTDIAAPLKALPLKANPTPANTILSRLLQLLHDKPNASINRILGWWPGLYEDDSAELLYELASRELLTAEDASRQQFADIVQRLCQQHEKQQSEGALLEKARHSPHPAPEELEQLNAWLESRRKPS